MLTNTLRIFYLKIIHILSPRYCPKIIADILKTKQKKKYVCKNEDEDKKRSNR